MDLLPTMILTWNEYFPLFWVTVIVKLKSKLLKNTTICSYSSVWAPICLIPCKEKESMHVHETERETPNEKRGEIKLDAFIYATRTVFYKQISLEVYYW